MPFSEDCCLISIFLKDFWKGLLRTVKGLAIITQPIKMTVFSGQHDGTTGRTDRVGYKAVVKANTFIGNSIDIGSLDQSVIIATNCFFCMVITHYKQYIRRLPGVA